MDTRLWKLSALELAVMVASREVSSLEVVEDHLERIAAVNAVTNTLADSAREAATSCRTPGWECILKGGITSLRNRRKSRHGPGSSRG